jgi:hypothetical protein
VLLSNPPVLFIVNKMPAGTCGYERERESHPVLLSNPPVLFIVNKMPAGVL